MKIFLFVLLAVFSCFEGFGQANTISAKTINASTSISIRNKRIDSVSSDASFSTSGSDNVIASQRAVKTYIAPIKSQSDSIRAGLLKDTIRFAHRGGIWLMYTSQGGDTVYDKAFSSVPGDAYIRTNTDSSLKIILKATGVVPGPYTNINATVDSTGRLISVSSGTPGSGNTNISVARTGLYNVVRSSTGTGDTLKTADVGNAGLMSPNQFTQSVHPFSVQNNDTVTNADTISYAVNDTLRFKAFQQTSADGSLNLTKNTNQTKVSYDFALVLFTWATAPNSANYTVTTANAIKLSDLSGQTNRNLVLPTSPTLRQQYLVVKNINTSGNTWTFTGGIVKAADNTTTTTIVSNNTYILSWDGTQYNIINK